jgi:hypothetical protein
MAKLKSFLKWLGDILDDILAYILTVVGILFSNIMPLMQGNESFDMNFGKWRIIGALIIALIVVGKQEQLPAEKETLAKAREGRRRNFWYRMSYALSQGFMWSALVNMGVQS